MIGHRPVDHYKYVHIIRIRATKGSKLLDSHHDLRRGKPSTNPGGYGILSVYKSYK